MDSEPVKPNSQLRDLEEELGSEKCRHEFWSCLEIRKRLLGRAERGKKQLRSRALAS